MTKERQLRLNAYLLGNGHHAAAWRKPEVIPGSVFDPTHYKRLAQIAEKGKMDAIFFADTVGLIPAPAHVRAQSTLEFYLEPLTLLSYLSASTSHIGLIATVSVSYMPPFHLARKFASLDLISEGRAGWNLVTSSSDYEAQNFGRDKQVGHTERYKMAREYVDVVRGLWDSFDDDAFIYDKEKAHFFRPDGLHELNHKGQYFNVKGPLHICRPPQGYPVLVQAGSSEDGQELAAATADVVFTAQQDLEDAKLFYRQLKNKATLYGRHPDEIIILPGIVPVIGDTEEEAREMYKELQELIPYESGLKYMSRLGMDFSSFNPDDPFPEVPVTQGSQSRQQLIIEKAKKEKLTVRQVSLLMAEARGHLTIFGTAESVAGQMEQWFREEAADGFNVMTAVYPSGLEAFVDKVIPLLQQRGLFRSQYEGSTLRENLGLKRPVNQFTQQSLTI